MTDLDRATRLAEAKYRNSSSREAMLEHLLIAEVLQEAWFGREQVVEVLRAEVDAAGYDLVFEVGAVLRHVQLKASERGGRTRRQTINVGLAAKPSGCVVWMLYEERNDCPRVNLSFLWFGGDPGHPLPALGDRVGMNPRSKTLRPNTRVITQAQFEPVATTTELVERLFGPVP